MLPLSVDPLPFATMHAPWFTDEIKAAKRKRRRLERQWHTDRTNAKHQLYTDQCGVVNDLT